MPSTAQPDPLAPGSLDVTLPNVDAAYLWCDKFQLDNGLTVVVHEDRKAPIVAIAVWYHIGSADEPAGKTGFAHLFEHLMYSGSEHHRDDFFGPFTRAGATDLNGTTWFDRTNYFQTVPATALDMALWMESDRMGHLLGAIEQKKLDAQRGVVQNEKRQGENRPYGRIDEIIQLNAFPVNHPYQHTTIGSMTDLNAASLDDVRRWFTSNYGAANATLVLAGDITPRDAKQKAIAYFGDIPSGPPVARQQPWIVARDRSSRGEVLDRVSHVRIYRQWNVPQWGHPDAPLLDLAASILGGGKVSRLHQRLVHRDQVAVGVSARLQRFSLASQFMVVIDVKVGIDPVRVETAIAEEWAQFLDHGPTQDELDRARSELFSAFVRRLEKVGGFGGKAAVLGEGQVFRNEPNAHHSDFASLAAATPADVLTAARNWIARGDYTLIVKPNMGQEQHGDPDIQGLAAAPGKPEPVLPIARKFKSIHSDIDRTSGVPRVAEFPDVTFPTVRRGTLRNGVEVIVAERRAIPVTQIRVQVGAGFAADKGRVAGTAHFVSNMLAEGTTTLDTLEIEKRQQRLGAMISRGVGIDASSITLNSFNRHLTPSLELFADMVRHPAFRPENVERLRAQTVASIARAKTDPAAIAQRILPTLVYGADHAYGIPGGGVGTEATVSLIERSDLVAFHRDFCRPGNLRILVAGSTTLEEIIGPLDAAFGDWTAPAPTPPAMRIDLVSPLMQPRLYLVHRPDSSQSLILGGALMASATAPDYLSLRLANAVFGGSFSSRLNMNLREDKHWAYGAQSGLTSSIGQGLMRMSASVQADKTAESITEMIGEMRAISADRVPSDEEIERVKLNEIRMLPGSYETTAAVLAALSDNELFGRPDDYVKMLKQRIEAQGVAEIQSVAKQLFSARAMTWVIVGDLFVIETPVRALDAGEVTILDTDGMPVR